MQNLFSRSCSTSRLPSLTVSEKTFCITDIDVPSNKLIRSKSYNEEYILPAAPTESSTHQPTVAITQENKTVFQESLTRKRLLFCRGCSTEHHDLCCEQLDQMVNNPDKVSIVSSMDSEFSEYL